MFEGIIYGYPFYTGQVQSAHALAVRAKTHARNHPNWPQPEILEVVTGVDRKDLLFNLAFQETIWMFKRHTYRFIWPDGLNLVVPHSQDYKISGRMGGLVGGKNNTIEHLAKAGSIGGKVQNGKNLTHEGRVKGGLKRVELRGTPNTPEGSSKGGVNCPLEARIRGALTYHERYKGTPEYEAARKKAGNRRFELHGVPSTPEGRSKGGKISGGMNAKNGHLARISILGVKAGGPIKATHQRCHVNRGVKNPNCKLCQEAV